MEALSSSWNGGGLLWAFQKRRDWEDRLQTARSRSDESTGVGVGLLWSDASGTFWRWQAESRGARWSTRGSWTLGKGLLESGSPRWVLVAPEGNVWRFVGWAGRRRAWDAAESNIRIRTLNEWCLSIKTFHHSLCTAFSVKLHLMNDNPGLRKVHFCNVLKVLYFVLHTLKMIL